MHQSHKKIHKSHYYNLLASNAFTKYKEKERKQKCTLTIGTQDEDSEWIMKQLISWTEFENIEIVGKDDVWAFFGKYWSF